MSRPRNGAPGEQFTKDIFFFHRYDPGVGAMDQNEWKLKFEAHITTISDSSSPSWNSSYDMGRADATWFYAGMNRTVNVSFQLIAMNKDEHYNNHEKLLARLGKLTYPIYKSGLGYNAPHVYFQIGGLYKGIGLLTSLNYNWNGDAVWIDNRPIYTEVSLTLQILADGEGKRPSVNSRYFI